MLAGAGTFPEYAQLVAQDFGVGFGDGKRLAVVFDFENVDGLIFPVYQQIDLSAGFVRRSLLVEKRGSGISNLPIITSLFRRGLLSAASVAPQLQSPGYAPSERLGSENNTLL